MKSSKSNARISFRLMLGLGLASYFTAGLIYAQVAGVRAYNNSGARHVDSNGTTGGGGGTGPGGGGPPDTPPPTTFQAAFTVQSSGYEVKANCVVCHNLSIKVGERTLTSGQVGNFKVGVNYPVRIIDNPDTSRPAGSAPPDHDTAKFTVWPEAVDGQTITKTDDDKAFVVSKNGVLQYIVDNQESLFAQDKAWDKGLLKKKGALVPLEIKVVDRDDPTKKWTDAKILSSGHKIYAGESVGDMASFKIAGPESWQTATYTWTAEGPNNTTIDGPTGVGKNEWKLADGDDDPVDWIDWKPGKYKIKCAINFGSNTVPVEIQQDIGWRTDDLLIIGQIIATRTHISDEPSGLVETFDFERAVLNDIGLGGVGTTLSALPSGVISQMFFKHWGEDKGHGDTPKGPFATSYPDNDGTVLEKHRYWMVNYMLNLAPDSPTVGTTITKEQLPDIIGDKQYRVLHHYQIKFLVTPDAKIDTTSIVEVQHEANKGITKIVGGALASYKETILEYVSQGIFREVLNSFPRFNFHKPDSLRTGIRSQKR